MSDPKDVFQEKLAKQENPDPEYHRLLDAYVKNPFDDMHLRPEEEKKKKLEEEKSALPPSVA